VDGPGVFAKKGPIDNAPPFRLAPFLSPEIRPPADASLMALPASKETWALTS